MCLRKIDSIPIIDRAYTDSILCERRHDIQHTILNIRVVIILCSPFKLSGSKSRPPGSHVAKNWYPEEQKSHSSTQGSNCAFPHCCTLHITCRLQSQVQLKTPTQGIILIHLSYMSSDLTNNVELFFTHPRVFDCQPRFLNRTLPLA